MTERRTGALGANVDLRATSARQVGQLGAMVDLAALINMRLVGGVGVVVDLVATLATVGIGWDGAQFVATGGTPVLWGASAFQSAGGYPAVQWETDHFEAEP